MSNWFATIQGVDNGYIVKFKNEEIDSKVVYGIKNDSDETNRDHFIKLLNDLIEYFGEGGSKYSKRRIHICYQSGDNKAEAKKGVEFDVID